MNKTIIINVLLGLVSMSINCSQLIPQPKPQSDTTLQAVFFLNLNEDNATLKKVDRPQNKDVSFYEKLRTIEWNQNKEELQLLGPVNHRLIGNQGKNVKKNLQAMLKHMALKQPVILYLPDSSGKYNPTDTNPAFYITSIVDENGKPINSSFSLLRSFAWFALPAAAFAAAAYIYLNYWKNSTTASK